MEKISGWLFHILEMFMSNINDLHNLLQNLHPNIYIYIYIYVYKSYILMKIYTNNLDALCLSLRFIHKMFMLTSTYKSQSNFETNFLMSSGHKTSYCTKDRLHWKMLTNKKNWYNMSI